jgi:hypothetical protein
VLRSPLIYSASPTRDDGRVRSGGEAVRAMTTCRRSPSPVV